MIHELWNEMDLEGRGHGLIWGTSSAFAWKDSRKATNHISQESQSLGFEPRTSLIQRRSANCFTTPLSASLETKIVPATSHALCLLQKMAQKISEGQIEILYEYILLFNFKSQIIVH